MKKQSTAQIIDELIRTYGGYGILNAEETDFVAWKWYTTHGYHYKYGYTNAFYLHEEFNGELVITRIADHNVCSAIFSASDAVEFITLFDRHPEYDPVEHHDKY